MRRAGANKKLAVTGAGHGARLIVRIGASADDRRIADSPRQLVCHSASRSRRRQIPALIQRDRADRPVPIVFGDKKFLAADATVLFRFFNFLQRVPAFLRKIKEAEKHGGVGGKKFFISEHDRHGTVGAVALDKNGNLAAATSTGGMANKLPGRIGDTPVIGAGTYANNQTCAVSCTGDGEYFVRAGVAHEVSTLMECRGMKLQEAAQTALDAVRKLGGSGGLIAIDKNGAVALP